MKSIILLICWRGHGKFDILCLVTLIAQNNRYAISICYEKGNNYLLNFDLSYLAIIAARTGCDDDEMKDNTFTDLSMLLDTNYMV